MVQRAKGERTRAAILDAALELFVERGYDATTMRAIAERAGVAVGNAYYYFASKDHLVQAFYDRMAVDHAAMLPARLDSAGDSLADRLSAYLVSWVEIAAPYRGFAAGLFRSAADPSSPLSPFSTESGPARRSNEELLAQVIDGAGLEVPDDVRASLPEILWLFHMGLVLFWVHDRSENGSATHLLVRRTVPLVSAAIQMSQVPALRSVVDDLVSLIADLKTALAPVTSEGTDT
jgi:AcrR family transcriptional regulator